ncbi:MAG TPA: hypothetical protein VHX86_14805 [Tepidisphaeraceae bacterium]|nr:hypothetical protein [Tepidisphaeraceae bacterium]
MFIQPLAAEGTMAPLYAFDAILFAVSAALLRGLTRRSIALLACIFVTYFTIKDHREGVVLQAEVQRVRNLATQRHNATPAIAGGGNAGQAPGR